MRPPPSTFDSALDQATHQLRARLLEDVLAAAERRSTRGGIRKDWREKVRQLAQLRGPTTRR